MLSIKRTFIISCLQEQLRNQNMYIIKLCVCKIKPWDASNISKHYITEVCYLCNLHGYMILYMYMYVWTEPQRVRKTRGHSQYKIEFDTVPNLTPLGKSKVNLPIQLCTYTCTTGSYISMLYCNSQIFHTQNI